MLCRSLLQPWCHLVSCWFDNLGFILREILAVVYIITLLLGRPTKVAKNSWRHQRSAHQEFLAPLSGIINSAPSKDINDVSTSNVKPIYLHLHQTFVPKI